MTYHPSLVEYTMYEWRKTELFGAKKLLKIKPPNLKQICLYMRS